MQVSSRVFFSCLKVDIKYYTKVFKRIGVKSSFFYDDEDLILIADALSFNSYKSAMIANRAKSLLEASKCPLN